MEQNETIGLAIEKIARALEILDTSHCSRVDNVEQNLSEAIDILRSVANKQKPHWEPPEQYQARTGEAWPEKAAVYALERRHTVLNDVIVGFEVMSYGAAKWKELDKIICATEVGPPPDDWMPEEGK
jgi:hypothetical protein